MYFKCYGLLIDLVMSKTSLFDGRTLRKLIRIKLKKTNPTNSILLFAGLYCYTFFLSIQMKKERYHITAWLLEGSNWADMVVRKGGPDCFFSPFSGNQPLKFVKKQEKYLNKQTLDDWKPTIQKTFFYLLIRLKPRHFFITFDVKRLINRKSSPIITTKTINFQEMGVSTIFKAIEIYRLLLGRTLIYNLLLYVRIGQWKQKRA